MIKREDFFEIRTKEDWNEQASKFKAAGIKMDKEMFEHLQKVMSQYEFSMEELNPHYGEDKEIVLPSFLSDEKS